MEHALGKALRRGAVPLCCSGATVCFTLYANQVSRAAQEWFILHKRTNDDDPVYDGEQFLRQATLLYQHAGTCVALAFTSAVATGEAIMDWHGYRGLETLDQMEAWLLKRPLPFLLRIPVVATGAASFLGASYVTGGIRFWQPHQPVIVTK